MGRVGLSEPTQLAKTTHIVVEEASSDAVPTPPGIPVVPLGMTGPGVFLI